MLVLNSGVGGTQNRTHVWAKKEPVGTDPRIEHGEGSCRRGPLQDAGWREELTQSHP